MLCHEDRSIAVVLLSGDMVSLVDPAEHGSRICHGCEGGMKLIVLSETLMVNPKK